jgi:hypothetical protein
LRGPRGSGGDGLSTLDLTEATRFVERYVSAGGPARPLGEIELRQLIRQRIRRDIGFERGVRPRRVLLGAYDVHHRARQLEAWRALRP